MKISLSRVWQVDVRSRWPLPWSRRLRSFLLIFVGTLALCSSPSSTLAQSRAAIQGNDMPSPTAKAGPLTDKEKETIHAWIESGARPPEDEIAPTFPQATPNDSMAKASGQKELSFLARLVRWIGKFHVLVVHFPIALFLEAVFAELLSMWRKERTPSSIVRFCVLLGAAGAVSAAGLGWLHAAFSAAGPRQILFLHRWLGTSAAVWSLGTVILSECDARARHRSKTFRIVLFLGAGLIGLAAHFGGTLVFGQHYFKW
jgi:uncharacterized membrane protein